MKRAFIILFIFSMTKTFACRCIENNESLSKKVEKAFAQADLIISGKVVEVKILNNAKDKYSSSPVLYKFEVTRTIKGKSRQEFIEITSEKSAVLCGYTFELGKSYLVYAQKSAYFDKMTKNEFDFVTTLCERNQKLNKVDKKEFRKLNKLNHSKHL